MTHDGVINPVFPLEYVLKESMDNSTSKKLLKVNIWFVLHRDITENLMPGKQNKKQNKLLAFFFIRLQQKIWNSCSCFCSSFNSHHDSCYFLEMFAHSCLLHRFQILISAFPETDTLFSCNHICFWHCFHLYQDPLALQLFNFRNFIPSSTLISYFQQAVSQFHKFHSDAFIFLLSSAVFLHFFPYHSNHQLKTHLSLRMISSSSLFMASCKHMGFAPLEVVCYCSSRLQMFLKGWRKEVFDII